jgi:PPOX class probable FMN-dependent enzyme
MDITTLEMLREQYAEPKERAVRKEIRALDVHCRRFIGLSPFLILATSDQNHNMDASPRGGSPGFVKVTADGAILIPDAPGNNRLDSFANIISTRKVGLLFLIPGLDETLRVNGSAVLSRADADIALCTDERRAPKLVIRVAVEAAYLHCAKAFHALEAVGCLRAGRSLDAPHHRPDAQRTRRVSRFPRRRARKWRDAMRRTYERSEVRVSDDDPLRAGGAKARR